MALKLVLQKTLFCILAGDDCFAYIAATESVYFLNEVIVGTERVKSILEEA